MNDHRLVVHGSSAVSTPLEIEARVELDPRAPTARFSYRLSGEIAQLAVPKRERARRADRLWEHTCFEAFVAPESAARYFELNFSPSTQWAAYAFDDYRQGMRPLALGHPPAITVAATARALDVTADIELDAFAAAPWPWRIGLTAVVEDRAGGRAFFALHHPREQPDFHDAAGFTITLDGSTR